jgi:MFS transporter, NNP family, nitrate/nitrite transporter
MSNLRRIIVLGVTTWAFVVCFAVWLMFGVIGIPIRKELGLNGLEFGLLTSTPVLTERYFACRSASRAIESPVEELNALCGTVCL